MSTKDENMLTLHVSKVTSQAIGINSYELVSPDGQELPPFTAGAHIDVHIPGGEVRQYSLCNDPAERHRYVIGVLRDEHGRGGSVALHDNVEEHDLLTTSVPRNNFLLSEEAQHHILIAGGIGITPLKSMAHYLSEGNKSFEIHYCAKGEEYAAFQKTLAPLLDSGQLFYHYDGGNPSNGLDIADLLKSPRDNTHVYYCGPGGFMSACDAATQHWPKGTIHFEHFKAPVRESTAASATLSSDAGEDTFTVKIASTGDLLEITSDQSIAEALSASGYEVQTSCQSGLCATCKVKYLEGEVDHRDFILDDDEKNSYLTACVSRATSPILVLDI